MYFKDKADQLTGVELDQFIDHVMRLMESIEFMQSTAPKTIVEQMLSSTLKGKSYKQQATNFNWNSLPPKSWGSATNNGYIVTYTSQNQGSSPEETKGSVIEFRLNPYFMIDRKAITSME
jgi:NADH:ubiquinone oxidoreductase subunit F (NADH-binding)